MRNRRFVEQGYTLKVYDCYRPQRAVDEFIAWGGNLADQRMKAESIRAFDKADVFSDGYIAERSGLCRGQHDGPHAGQRCWRAETHLM